MSQWTKASRQSQPSFLKAILRPLAYFDHKTYHNTSKHLHKRQASSRKASPIAFALKSITNTRDKICKYYRIEMLHLKTLLAPHSTYSNCYSGHISYNSPSITIPAMKLYLLMHIAGYRTDQALKRSIWTWIMTRSPSPMLDNKSYKLKTT